MTNDEKEAVRLEEAAVLASLETALERLQSAREELSLWIMNVGGRADRPPAVDISHDALTVQLNVMALYRVRLWRKRFG